jgi:hypothetical protein
MGGNYTTGALCHCFHGLSVVNTGIFIRNYFIDYFDFWCSLNMPFNIMTEIVFYSAYLPMNIHNMTIPSIMEIIQKILVQKL